MDESPNDTARHDAPQRDEPRQPAPLDPAHFTMTVDDVSARFADAGLPRSVRSIQRYCQRGHLSCTTVDTEGSIRRPYEHAQPKPEIPSGPSSRFPSVSAILPHFNTVCE